MEAGFSFVVDSVILMELLTNPEKEIPRAGGTKRTSWCFVDMPISDPKISPMIIVLVSASIHYCFSLVKLLVSVRTRDLSNNQTKEPRNILCTAFR